RQRACLAATGSWTACSRRIIRAELRRLKTTPLMGPAPRRSALRENRRLARAETIARIFRTNFAAHSRAARAWFHIEKSSSCFSFNLLTGMSHGGVDDPLQRPRLKIQVAFCLGIRHASHLSPVVNRIRTTIRFQSIPI